MTGTPSIPERNSSPPLYRSVTVVVWASCLFGTLVVGVIASLLSEQIGAFIILSALTVAPWIGLFVGIGANECLTRDQRGGNAYI
jgi:purine-cytosine permease-like protein